MEKLLCFGTKNVGEIHYRGQFHPYFCIRLFQSFFATRLVQLANATCTAKCNLRMANQHKFHTKKHGEIHFQKQADFLCLHEKDVRKCTDEIDTRGQHGSQTCFASFI
jgi:hypothetical protein